MSIFAKRMLFACGAFSLFAALSFVAAVIVEYKPWGVHDLQREEYNEIIAKIEKRASLKGVPKPELELKSVRNPEGVRQPGDLVTTVITVLNRGSLELQLDRKANWPEELRSQQTFPIKIAPGAELAISIDWHVPADPEALSNLSTILRSNDPLNEEIDVTPECEVAKSFFVAHELIEDVELSSVDLVAVNHVFSQRYDEFVVEDFIADSRLLIETEPERDEAILQQNHAKFGMKLKVTLKAGTEPTKLFLPVKVTAWNDQDRQELEFQFSGVIKSPIAFFGPDLDVRSGYRLGVIKLGSKQSWNLFARVKSDQLVDDLTAEVSPDGLEVTVSRARSDAQDFRITLRLSDNAKPVSFQADKQGFVKVFSPSNPSIANWIPIRGVIIEPAK